MSSRDQTMSESEHSVSFLGLNHQNIVGKSKEEIMNLVAQERSIFMLQIQQLSAQVQGLTASNTILVQDKNELLKQLEFSRDMVGNLKKELHDLVADNDSLRKELENVRQRLIVLEKAHDELLQPIGAREIASRCDIKAMDFIFPHCRRKPWCLRSYSNLLSFLSNPHSDDYSGPDAPGAWLKLSEEQKTATLKRKAFVVERYSYLKLHIMDLKKKGNEVAHRATSFDELYAFYSQEEDPELLEALLDCQTFLDTELTTVVKAEEETSTTEVDEK